MNTVFRHFAYMPFQLTGINPWQVVSGIRGIHRYLSCRREFLRARTLIDDVESVRMGGASPCTMDWYENCGNTSEPYFSQDLYVATQIFEENPKRHIDVGSRVDGFVAHVAAFRTIEVVDIRPAPKKISNVIFLQADFMSDFPDVLLECCDSASCLHALEHFGLGRYGDPIDCLGHIRGLQNLWRMLKPGGKLYLSVPIGKTRVEFNSQRVFSVDYMLRHLEPMFDLVRMSYIDDEGVLHVDVELNSEARESSFGCRLGCGIFELVKSLSKQGHEMSA